MAKKSGNSRGKAAPVPTVDDLLAERAARRRGGGQFTPEQLAQVKRALEINDAEPNMHKRLSSAVLAELLREHYGFTGSRPMLERMIVDAFGRKSWSEK